MQRTCSLNVSCHHRYCITRRCPRVLKLCSAEETKITPLALAAACMDKELPLSKLRRAPSSHVSLRNTSWHLSLEGRRPGQNCRISLAFCKTEAHFPIFHFRITLSSHLQPSNRIRLAHQSHQVQQTPTEVELSPRRRGWKSPNPKLSLIAGGDKAAFLL